MRKCIDYLCQMSGQLVSFEKYMYGDLLGGVDNVQRRLATWKTESLSMVDRVTLIQSVTAVIPVYTMQTVKLSMTVSQELDRLNKNFIWGTTDRRKNRGGLGLKKTEHVNQALLAKTGWRLMKKDNEQGLVWHVGNGQKTRFWLDNWLGIGHLLLHAQCSTPNVLLQDGDIEDKIRWGFIADGLEMEFFLWKISAPPKVLHFLWKVCHRKLLTNSHRIHIGLSFDASCPRCSCICEALNHLFRNCSESAALWRKLNMVQMGVFEPDSHLDTPLEIGVLRDLTEWKDTIKVKAYKPSKQHSLVRWQPPSKGKYKLNTNGCRSEDGAIGVGELSKITLVLGWVASLQT
ncbi:hypothetical protein Prudu_016536 [Prunus dulcis]|uniref:Reverse transcriptase zinc-binding domain-containing protein n=1 Tax=Prunus dulcis TaxID=3755 RepID=A0A4Y1RLI2_PRUDU|nr:hypothetical protein Prudu_016536 [Prunus dulcis]